MLTCRGPHQAASVFESQSQPVFKIKHLLHLVHHLTRLEMFIMHRIKWKLSLDSLLFVLKIVFKQLYLVVFTRFSIKLHLLRSFNVRCSSAASRIFVLEGAAADGGINAKPLGVSQRLFGNQWASSGLPRVSMGLCGSELRGTW